MAAVKAKVYMKMHMSESGVIVALCDESITGKIIEDGDILIDLKTYADFYTGELLEPNVAIERIADLLPEVSSSNVVGKKAVEVALKAKMISEDHVMKASGIPYAHSYKVPLIR